MSLSNVNSKHLFLGVLLYRANTEKQFQSQNEKLRLEFFDHRLQWEHLNSPCFHITFYKGDSRNLMTSLLPWGRQQSVNRKKSETAMFRIHTWFHKPSFLHDFHQFLIFYISWRLWLKEQHGLHRKPHENTKSNNVHFLKSISRWKKKKKRKAHLPGAALHRASTHIHCSDENIIHAGRTVCVRDWFQINRVCVRQCKCLNHRYAWTILRHERTLAVPGGIRSRNASITGRIRCWFWCVVFMAFVLIKKNRVLSHRCVLVKPFEFFANSPARIG